MNRTKIICTAGPSIDSAEQILKLAQAGMSILRINCSHGEYRQYERSIGFLREAEQKMGRPLAVMIDLQGPKLRVGNIPEPLPLKTGETWCFSPKVVASAEAKTVPVPMKGFAGYVAVGGHFFLDDGLIEVRAVRRTGENLFVKVIVGGLLQARKGMNIPFFKGPLAALTAKDKKDLLWGLKTGVDMVALSFVRRKEDLILLKKIINTNRAKLKPLVIAKIEKPEAVEHLEEIARECDGLLVARGDLGIELSQEKVPVVQKQMIELSRQMKIPTIVATQMLDSMRLNPIPTRAEVSDVANTIFSAADAVLLTGETSSGKYPVKTCQMLASIVREVEEHMVHKSFHKRFGDFGLSEYPEIFLFHAMEMADKVGVKAIVMLTKQGNLIRIMSKFHPRQPVYCLAPTAEMARRLQAYWGIFPIKIDTELPEDRIAKGLKLLTAQGVVRAKDRLLFVYRDFKTDDLNLKIMEV